MLKNCFKIVLFLMVFDIIRAERVEQNSTSQPENSTEPNQEDTTNTNIQKPIENVDNPASNESSTSSLEPSNTENPEPTQIDGMHEDAHFEINQDEIVGQISSLSEQILDLIEVYANQKAINSNSPQNSTTKHFFLAFMTEKSDDSSSIGRKMTVNNNFHGSQIVPTQVYIEKGTGHKQPPSPNIQMTLPRQNQIPMQNEQNNRRGGEFMNFLKQGLPIPYQQIPIPRNLWNKANIGK